MSSSKLSISLSHTLSLYVIFYLYLPLTQYYSICISITIFTYLKLFYLYLLFYLHVYSIVSISEIQKNIVIEKYSYREKFSQRYKTYVERIYTFHFHTCVHKWRIYRIPYIQITISTAILSYLSRNTIIFLKLVSRYLYLCLYHYQSLKQRQRR